MSENSGDNVVQIVNDISCELAKRELGFKKTDEKDQKKLEKLALKINENRDEVKKIVDSISNTTKLQYHGIEQYKELRFEAAQNVLNQVRENDLTNPSEINTGEDVSKEVLVSVLQNSNKDLKNIEKTLSSTRVLSDIKNIEKILQYKNNKKLIINGKEYEPKSVEPLNPEIKIPPISIENSDDPAWDFKDTEDADAELMIQTREDEFHEIFEEILSSPNPEEKIRLLDDVKRGVKDTRDGLGVDAVFRMLRIKVMESGEKSPEEIELLEKFSEIGFNYLSLQNQDAYTTETMVNLLVTAMSNVDKYPEYQKMIDNFRERQPQMYAAVSQNLKEFQSLQRKKVTDDNAINGINEILGIMRRDNKDAYGESSVKEFIELAIGLSKEAYATETLETLEALRSVPEAFEKQNHNTKNLELQDDIIGKLLDKKDSPELNTDEAKKLKMMLFQTIIEQRLSEKQPLSQELSDHLAEIDLDCLKGVLQETILPGLSGQNDSTVYNQHMQSIGESIKKASKKLVLDPIKTDLAPINGENTLIEPKKQIKDERTIVIKIIKV